MTTMLNDIEGLTPGEYVELYKLDLNPIGQDVIFRWSPSRQDGGSLWWQGYEYISRPVSITGLVRSGQEKPPEPMLVIGNLDGAGYALLNNYGDILNAKLTRTVTNVKYLDRTLDGDTNPSADSSSMFIPEIWLVGQLQESTPLDVKIRLNSPLDIIGKKLPARRALRNICGRTYRTWDAATGTFKYAAVNACPYVGSAYFTKDNAATADASKDDCSLDLEGCKPRFPGQNLPTWAFPALRKF